VGGRHERGNVLIRVGNPFGPLVETGTVGVDDGCSSVKDLLCCGYAVGIFAFSISVRGSGGALIV